MCEDVGTGKGDVATGRRAPGMARSHQKLEESTEQVLPQLLEGTSSANALTAENREMISFWFKAT